MKFFYYTKVIIINLFFIYFLLYALEIFLNSKDKKLFKKTRVYYLSKEKEKNPDRKFYLNFGSYKLIDKKNKILPLSGYENSNILLCLNENNEPIFFKSDDNGFNNINNNNNNIDVLIIGDSYAQGMCVNNDHNLSGQFKKLNINSLSFGVGGNGPLLEFASFKEYASNYKFDKLILFISPDNDYYDLSNEKNNKILMNYLEDENFKQNLTSSINKENKKIILDKFFGNKTEKLWGDFVGVYHFDLKKVGNLIEDITKRIKKKENNYHNYLYLKNKEIDQLYFEIIDNLKNSTKLNDTDFYIVFNSMPPNILYPKDPDQNKLRKLLDKKILEMKSYLDDRSIKYFDFSEYLLKNYNENNISSIFKNINNRWDHYTEIGYKIKTIEINNLIK